MRHYIERNEKEEWYTPCHLLPMFEYTHYEGRQLVQSIVKQEELKLLKTKEGAMEAMKEDNSVSDLPELVRDALLGMPHTNSRKTSKKWYDHYDQETMDLTYEMYKMDFVTFGYDVAIKERPDLVPPRINRRSQMHSQASWSRNSYVNDSGVRTSQAKFSLVSMGKFAFSSSPYLMKKYLMASPFMRPRSSTTLWGMEKCCMSDVPPQRGTWTKKRWPERGTSVVDVDLMSHGIFYCYDLSLSLIIVLVCLSLLLLVVVVAGDGEDEKWKVDDGKE